MAAASQPLAVGDIRPGLVLGRKAVAVLPGKVEAFLDSVGQVRGDGALAPFALLSTEPWGWPGAYLPYWKGGVATGMTWQALRRVPVGATLEVRATVAERYVSRSRENSTVRVEIRDADDNPCWHGSGTYSARVDPETVDPAVERRGANPAPDQPAGPWHQLGGMTFPRGASRQCWSLREDIGADNFHTSLEVAQAMGLPDVLIGSSHLLAWLGEIMPAQLGPRFSELGGITVAFKGMVMANEAVVAEVASTAPHPGEAGRALLQLRKADGAVVLTGAAWRLDGADGDRPPLSPRQDRQR